MVRKTRPRQSIKPETPVRPLWSNDECREGVRGKGPDGGMYLPQCGSAVPRASGRLNLHAFCSHIHRVKTKSIVKSCSVS